MQLATKKIPINHLNNSRGHQFWVSLVLESAKKSVFTLDKDVFLSEISFHYPRCRLNIPYFWLGMILQFKY